MISEILKILPRLDDGALNKMEKTLNGRFARVAKKFSGGLINAIKGAGVVGLVVGFIDKLLNPLKETQDAIDRMIRQGDEIVGNAETFGTTAGKLFKLTKFAQATGLDSDGLFQLMSKYQSAIVEAQADPTKATSVRAYANDTDIAESFFQFIQQLNKLSKTDMNKAIQVQKEVFGEKQVLKMGGFLRGDFGKLATQMKLRGSEAYTPTLEKFRDLNDQENRMRAAMESEDLFVKGRRINKGMVNTKMKMEQDALTRENDRIKSYQNLANLSRGMDKILGFIEQIAGVLGGIVGKLTPYIEDLIKYLKAIAGSRMVRGMVNKATDW